MTSKAPKLLTITGIIFVFMAMISAYMVWHHYQLINGEAGFTSFCSISEKIDCDAVNSSVYSEIFGVPLATLALAYYMLAAILSFVGARNSYSRRESLALLTTLSSIGVLVSIAAFIVSFFVLKKICLLCGILQTFNVVTFATIVLALRAYAPQGGLARDLALSNRKKLLTYLAVGLGILIVTQGLTSQLREDRYPLPDPEEFVNEFRSQPIHNIDPGNSPRLGFQGDNPPVRLIEFADYQCPACGVAAQLMHRLLDIYGKKIQVIFKQFPLDQSCNQFIRIKMHEHACFAAKAAICAKKQGKFERLHHKMFSRQRDLNRENILTWARELGLDVKALEDCIPSTETASELNADIVEGDKGGLMSTPTFFVNGRIIKGPIDETRLKLLLKELGQ